MSYLTQDMLESALDTRRRFVRRFVVGLAGSTFLGKSWKNPFLLEVAADVPADTAQLQISLNDFPVLRNELGSMRLSVNPIASDHFPDGNHYPVVISHAGRGKYYALSSRCSHASCVVDAFDPFEQGMLCPCHNSLYAITGQVIRGPAKRNLQSYAITYDGHDQLVVTVPGLSYRVTPSLLRGPAGSRLALHFPTWPNVSYEVRLRTQLTDPGAVVLFSNTVDGTLDQSSLLGDDQPATVFVEPLGERGFYEVSLVLLDLG